MRILAFVLIPFLLFMASTSVFGSPSVKHFAESLASPKFIVRLDSEAKVVEENNGVYLVEARPLSPGKKTADELVTPVRFWTQSLPKERYVAILAHQLPAIDVNRLFGTKFDEKQRGDYFDALISPVIIEVRADQAGEEYLFMSEAFFRDIPDLYSILREVKGAKQSLRRMYLSDYLHYSGCLK